jgi:hypothetical protein
MRLASYSRTFLRAIPREKEGKRGREKGGEKKGERKNEVCGGDG